MIEQIYQMVQNNNHTIEKVITDIDTAHRSCCILEYSICPIGNSRRSIAWYNHAGSCFYCVFLSGYANPCRSQRGAICRFSDDTDNGGGSHIPP